jgi:hypothetical protein
MKYFLAALGFILLAIGLVMVTSLTVREGVPGGLLATAGAILLVGGSIMDQMAKKM